MKVKQKLSHLRRRSAGPSESQKSPCRVHSQFFSEMNELASLLQACSSAKAKVLERSPECQLKDSLTLAQAHRAALLQELCALRSQKAHLEVPSAQSEFQFKILRKLNQDSSYALNQLKEAVLEAEEDSD